MKEHMAEIYNSHAALRSPPHITLHMPFRWNPQKEMTLIGKVQEALDTIDSFLLELDGFDVFEPRVIYIHVKRSDSLHKLYDIVRKAMQATLHSDNAGYKNRGFTPHMTVAFRDLRKAAYHEAWAEFSHKKFAASWMVESVVLLKHTGSHWEPFYTLPFYRGS